MNGHLDLEEQAIRVRSAKSRQHIEEALRCFRSGGFRSAIVQTWIAVVQDVFEKVRELAVGGDAQATTFVATLDAIVRNHDVAQALATERDILRTAKDTFELITQNEYLDLERLQDDRQRCAHPSLNTPDDVYTPSPELARLHLRNALDHLLTRPPTQSRAVLGQLQQEVDGQFFPASLNEAIDYMRASPLARPRPSLLRSFCIAIMTSTLTENLALPVLERRLLALRAARELHREGVERCFAERLSQTIRRVTDENILAAFRFLGVVDGLWPMLDRDVQVRLETALDRIAINDVHGVVHYSMLVPELKPRAAPKLADASSDTLAALLKARTLPEYAEQAIAKYLSSGSFAAANARAQSLIVPFIAEFSPAHLDRICNGVGQNGEITGSYSVREVYEAIDATGRAAPQAIATFQAALPA